MPWKLVRWEDLTAKPWKNGGGTTRQVVAAPLTDAASADPDWSVSIAEIEVEGPFSEFPGIDRVIMLVGGAGMILDVDGTAHRLGSRDTLAFDGGAATACRLPAGPARGLNLMTRRGRAVGSSRAVDVDVAYEVTVEDGETVVLVAVTAGLSLDGGAALRPLDSVVGAEPGSVRVTGNGTVAEVRIAQRTG